MSDKDTKTKKKTPTASKKSKSVSKNTSAVPKKTENSKTTSKSSDLKSAKFEKKVVEEVNVTEELTEDVQDELLETAAHPITFTLVKKHLVSLIMVVALIVLGVIAYLNLDLFVIATVNGSPITRYQVWTELESQFATPAVDGLIRRKLIAQEAANKNITVSQEDLDAEIAKISDTLTQQGTTLDFALSSQGLDRDVFNEQLKLQLTLEKLVEASEDVSDEELETAVKNYVSAGQEDTPELRESVKEQLKQSKQS
ncbi:SurA N-terminal domain-containing protein, partial [candidate division WWE3 bacterium]|nr:SurA N-terminal domain-containing protein [candidate division WWE3 bacterium]